MRTVHLQIRGKVQGVFYRVSARDKGAGLGLHGWVRNCPDGSVEAVAGGAAEAVEQFIAWCRTGSARAVVTEVRVQEIDPVEATGFRVIRE
ncbi:MAG TPA: acylphosphatase [Chitinophagaceae bacterium]|nr:acylphosphatase [Chitinophagaceae bacterium]